MSIALEVTRSDVVLEVGTGEDVTLEVGGSSVSLELLDGGLSLDVTASPVDLEVTSSPVELVVSAIGLTGPTGPAGAANAIDLAANCLAGDAVEDLVYVTGPPILGLAQVAKVDIDDGAKMPAAGVIVSKSAPTVCVVRAQGEYSIAGATLAAGDPVFASPTGTLDTTPPSRPGAGSRFIQRLGIALTDSKLALFPSPLVHEIRP